MNDAAKAHVEAILDALRTLDVHPRRVAWHYLQAVYEITGQNKSHTAERLGMHRRHVQRILIEKGPPPAHPHGMAPTRPGDAAAILAEEEGIDYATALVMTNTD